MKPCDKSSSLHNSIISHHDSRSLTELLVIIFLECIFEFTALLDVLPPESGTQQINIIFKIIEVH